VVSFTPWPLYSQGKSTWYLDRRLGGSQSRSGHGGGKKRVGFVVVFIIIIIIALGYELDDRGFEFRQWLGIFLFTKASRLDLNGFAFLGMSSLV
jgi:hypothetical protein